jgi:HK97 gp10 family phage protein
MLTFEVDSEFLRALGNLADIDRIAPKMLEEAVTILESNVKYEVAKHKRTGNMYKSIRRTKVQRTKSGGYKIVVRPTGKATTYMDDGGKVHERKEPYRNMAILAHLEYGTSKITSRPILTKAIEDSREAVYTKMREVFNREVDKK